MFRRPVVLTAAVLVPLAALAACGGKTTDSGGKSASVAVTQAQSLRDQLPSDVKSKGTLVIATDPSYAPIEFTKGGSGFQGFDIDLGNAIGQALGLKITFKAAQFDGILAGVTAKRYDLAMSAFTDNKAREQQNDFVTYFKAGTSIGVKKGNPKKITSQDSLCGLKVGAEKGTTQADALTKDKDDSGNATLRGTCLSKGKSAPVPVLLPDQNAVNTAVVSGRADAFIGDSPIVAYQAKLENGQIQQGGTTTDVAPYGIALPKGSDLAPVLQKTVQQLIDDGTYKKIIDTWGLQDGAITQSVTNGATS